MALELKIVGLGETVLVERPDGTEAAGLAALVAIHAVRLGHVGVVVSRIGQDNAATALTDLLVAARVDVSHVQLDPDLPTGRVVVSRNGESRPRYVDATAAFDNLQADFDLEDVAQQADAVVYGLLTRRSGQTRSEENRFLESCGAAMKLFDLTNRENDSIDRRQAASGLELADAAIIDDVVWNALQPGHDAPDRAAVVDLIRDAHLAFVLRAVPGGGVELHTDEAAVAMDVDPRSSSRTAMMLTVLTALLRGDPVQDAADAAQDAAAHADDEPSEDEPRADPVPEA
jgi:sugar/nucleoside kinase (ribokinase family)